MPQPETIERAKTAFRRAGGHGEPLLVRAPGRINLLGEHTDYNDGLCLPAAIDRDLVVAAAPANSGFALVSDAADPAPIADAVAAELGAMGRPALGLVAGIASEVPVGAGLSSSAAYEVGTGLALAATANWEIPPMELAAACRRAEYRGLGVPCGPLDQIAVVAGRAGKALFLDCRNLAVTPTPLPGGTAIVVVDSGIKRALAASGYETRVQECREAAALLGIASLRDAADVPIGELEARLPPVLFRRVRHVLTENNRVTAAAALRGSDPDAFGALMNASHASLSRDYEVSLPELDALAARVRAIDGVFGARLTGAGFGGSVIALVGEKAAGMVARTIEEPTIAIRLAGGAEILA